ncbi:MAG: glycosyltransferase [Gammaproteobacteria bacterium]|nr:glycosyltransferase [Gammaproteobacteria bacterium]
MKEKTLLDIPGVSNEILPPVSLIVPAYEEESTISSAVKALMQLEYPVFEVIVVNDGSSDGTLTELINGFELEEFPEAYRKRIDAKPINKIYRSKIYHRLRVVDKVNGGKSDAINSAINVSRYPLVCVVDADSILQRDSLKRVVQPFVFDNRTVASGGTVRIVNGCEFRDGFIINPGAPDKLLPLIQVVEYLRAFLFGRLGWSPLNALLIISGAFGVFHKETVIAVGGFRNDTIGEDMELVVRMHRILRKQKKPYRITFVPDPVCWTKAPEKLSILAHQRIRWQRGLCESLFSNFSLFMNPRAGAVGLLAFPFMLFFEWAGPLIEVIGLVVIVLGFIYGYIDPAVFSLLLGVAIVFGMLLSLTALLLEEISFHIYQKPRELFKLFLVSILENFGYRQLNTVWRLIGFAHWLFGTKRKWVRVDANNNVMKSQDSAVSPN